MIRDKRGSNFNINGITKKEHKYDLLHSVELPEEICSETYNGETGRRVVKRTDGHKGKSNNSYVCRHSVIMTL